MVLFDCANRHRFVWEKFKIALSGKSLERRDQNDSNGCSRAEPDEAAAYHFGDYIGSAYSCPDHRRISPVIAA